MLTSTRGISRLTKLLLLQQTACAVHELPLTPRTVIGEQLRPIRPSMEGRTSPSSPPSSLSDVALDYSMAMFSVKGESIEDEI